MGVWILAVLAFGYLFGMTSFASWTVLGVVALVPPAAMVRLWNAPPPSISETIRDVLR